MPEPSAPQHPDVVVPLAARTTSGNSGPLSAWGGARDIVSKLIVTALSGTTPSVTVVIEHADSAAGPWTALDSYPAQSATTPGITRNVTGASKPFVRVAWTIAGTTPSVTFSVTLSKTSALMLVG